MSTATLHLLSEHLQMMQVHTEASYPQEACGLLLGSRQGDRTWVVDIQPTLNAWSPEVAEWIGGGIGKVDRFWIDPAEIFQVMREARSRSLEIIGVYHSHPDHPAIPSECDRRMAWIQYTYVIISVMGGQMVDCRAWQLDGDHQFELVDLVWATSEGLGQLDE
jgi:proteasome lid subunit RPN8/RPN11